MQTNTKYLIVGGALTAGYLALIAFGRFTPESLDWIRIAPLNEVGDFLAGAFAPLAFLWLVIGYWMQSEELNLQRQELKENTEALEKQADILEKEFERAVATQQPRFRIGGGSVSGKTRKFSLFNDGQLATNVVAMIGEDYRVLGPETVQDEARISFNIDRVKNGSPLKITYEDAAGNRYRLEGIISVDEAGRVLIGDLVPPTRPEPPVIL